MDTEILDSFVTVPGGSVFVRRWRAGPAADSPVVLLHDSLGSVEQWRDFPAALALSTGREIVAYDRLGFGRSTPRASRPGIEFIDDEARTFFPAIRQALGVGRFSLFGHSVGGAMAVAIASTTADACDAVITEAAQAFVEARTLAGIHAAQAQFADPAQFDRLARWHGDKARWVLDSWTEVWLAPEFANWNLDADLARVSCPLLAIHGDTDEFGSEAFPRRITARAGGRAELAILEQCGHVPHRERQEEVLSLTKSFLDRSRKASTRFTPAAAPD